jgi:glucokinase
MLEMMLKLYIEEKQEGRRAVCEQAGSGVGLANIASYLAYGDLPDEKNDSRIKSIKKHRSEFIEFAKSIGLFEVPLNKEDENYVPPQLIGRKLIEAYKKGEHKKILGVAMDIMVGAAAIAARSNVHSFLGYDGILIVGGNARRLDRLYREKFPEEFDNSGSHVERIESTPIFVLTKEANKLIGSMGAAYYALNKTN